MDREGEEGAGTEPVDALEAVQLARLEAAGPPARLPNHLRNLWLAHAGVLEPSLGLVGGKLYLVKRASDFRNLWEACYFASRGGRGAVWCLPCPGLRQGY